ncbi:Uroporphyrinogen-III synthase HemD [Gracilaria domingensis]|nr:Uroporphyrinogen-III synthase HemD [Gracilaria domingensis]
MAFVAPALFSRHRGSNPICSRRQQSQSRYRFSCVAPRDIDSDSVLKTFHTYARVALTREIGKNKALHDELRMLYPRIEIVRLPCVETVTGEDSENLPIELEKASHKWIVVTSPEAASIFIEAWRSADYPSLCQIAAVGKATGDCLRAVGIDVSFEPSKATGKTLVREFPPPETNQESVLYPASLKASNVIVDGLSSLGYEVLRLNTYSTEPVEFSEGYKVLGAGTHIVTFASPSAVKSWVRNVGVQEGVTVACIGETSAKAAREVGFKDVYFPESPGLEGWVNVVCEALKKYEGGIVTRGKVQGDQ